MRNSVERSFYHKGLAWIVDHRGGHNGRWPPREVKDCVGWQCVRIVADLTDRRPREVAIDLIDAVKQAEETGNVQAAITSRRAGTS